VDVAKIKNIPFLTGIFGIELEKSPVLTKKIQKNFRSHVLNSLLVGRLVAGELLDAPVRDTHPGTLLVPPGADGSHTCNVRFTPKSGHGSAQL